MLFEESAEKMVRVDREGGLDKRETIAKHLIGTVPDVPTGHKGVEEKTMKRNKLLDSDSWTIWTRGAASWTWFADLPLIIWWWTSL